MANYEYIISSLPALAPDWKPGESSFDQTVEWIKSQLGPSDKKTVDRLLSGFKEENLDRDFYVSALNDGNRFIREYFGFDLNFRNAKARFLNKAFGMPENKDTIDAGTGEFEEAQKMDAVLAMRDLLKRERSLDSLVWDKIGELTLFSYFDLDSVLGYIAKLHIIDRWTSLDVETGREMFFNLIDEVRGTFKGVKDNIIYED